MLEFQGPFITTMREKWPTYKSRVRHTHFQRGMALSDPWRIIQEKGVYNNFHIIIIIDFRQILTEKKLATIIWLQQ